MGKQRKELKSKIEGLTPKEKEHIKDMINRNEYLSEVFKYIKNRGYNISASSVQRFAARHRANMTALQLASESFKSMADELAKYPDMDITEGILRMLCQHIFDKVSQITEEDLKGIEITELIKQTNTLVRAVTNKKHTDAKIRELMDNGYEAVKKVFFDAMAKDDPVLYEQLVQYINKKKSEGIRL